MRAQRFLYLLTLAVVSPLCVGCDVFYLGTRNLLEAPADKVEECADKARNRVLAEAAWDDYGKCHPDACASSYFSQGFVDGFADYLNYGGNGQPPPVPPWRYQRYRYKNPDGLEADEEWFAGFRAGAAAAIASGLRRLEVVPGSGATVREVDVRPANVQAPPAAAVVVPVVPPTAPEQLPPPKRDEPQR